MKNLKKLTRKGLDELAQEMPQVNERQQGKCVGGAEYYDNNPQGLFNYIGSAGYSQTIHFCTTSEFSLKYQENLNSLGFEYGLGDYYEGGFTERPVVEIPHYGGTPLNEAPLGLLYSFFSTQLSNIENISGLVITKSPVFDSTEWYASGGIVHITLWDDEDLSRLNSGAYDPAAYNYYFTGEDLFLMKIDINRMINSGIY